MNEPKDGAYKIFEAIRNDEILKKQLVEVLLSSLDLRANRFHPLVFINGTPGIGTNVYIGLFSEINAKGADVVIGDNCDIASFVSINVADTHKKCIGLSETGDRKPIIIEHDTFIGSHCFIKGGAHIGHHSVIAAGTMVNGVAIPPYSLVFGNPMNVREEYYKNKVMK